MRKMIISALTAAAAAAVMGGAGMAAASTHAAVSGTEHFQMMTTAGTQLDRGSVIASGVLHRPRQSITSTRQPTPARSRSLTARSFIKHSNGTGTQHFDPTTCLMTINEHGTYKLLSGTGKYAGISGSGTYQLSILGHRGKPRAASACRTSRRSPSTR